MSIKKAVANALSFAHLSGLVSNAKAAKSSKAEGDDEKDKDDDSDTDSDDDKKAKAEDHNDTDHDDSGNETDKKGKKAKKAKAEDEDEDDGEDDAKSAAAYAGGAHAERNRCKAIVAHGVKVGAVLQACAYAFDTSMSVEVAVATLDGTASERSNTAGASAGTLAARMASLNNPVVTPEAPAASADTTDPKAIAAMVIAAAAKASGKA